MNILVLGVGDSGLDDPHGEPVRRQLEYARLAGGRIDVIVDSPRTGVSVFGPLTIHRTGRGRLSYARTAFQMARDIARMRMPDLITSQDPFATALVGTWLRRTLRRPLLIQNHSSVLFNRQWAAERPFFHRGLHLLARYLLPRADAWRVVNTREQRMYVERLKLPAGRVWCVPVPCGLAAFADGAFAEAVVRMRGRLGFPQGTPILLWAGRPVRFKRVPVLYAAFADIRRSFPRARLVIAGRRDLAQEDLPRAEKRAGVGDAVTWMEDIYLRDLAALYGASDVFLFPSLYEGFGRVLVEAGAAGLPAVATATSGAADILRDGETGYLTPIEDPAAMAEKACALLDDPALRKELGARARRRVSESFDPAKLFEAVVAQWRETAAVGLR
jgi:glycosyltransferase involved in cell wall biosynthesis